MTEFEHKVWCMRQWQKRFFADRDTRALEQSKVLEAEVDKYLDKMVHPELF